MGKTTKKTTGPRAKYRYGAGLDVHKHYVTACVAVQRGVKITKVALQEFKQSPEGHEDLCRFLGKYLLEVIVMEATGVYTWALKQALSSYDAWGLYRPPVVVINPNLVKKYPGEIHQDKADALELARLWLLGIAKGSFIPTGAARELRVLTREVDVVERDCTRAKNRVKRILDAWGLPLQDLDLSAGWATDLFRALDWANGHFGTAIDSILSGTFPVPHTSLIAVQRRAEALATFKDVALPPTACEVLRGHLIALAFHETLIGMLGQAVEGAVESVPTVAAAVRSIVTVGGISEETAASLVAEVGNVYRFENVKKFLQYAGCAPAIYQSGQVTKKGHLNRRVNTFLKRRLYNAGKAICVNVKFDSDLKEYARAQMNRHWAKTERKLAFMNTGIKLARVLYAILKEGRSYDPFYESNKNPTHGEPTESTEGESADAPSQEQSEEITQLRPVTLRNLRKRARQFARYVQEVCGGNSAEWYGTLSRYFSLLQNDGGISP
jgi:transposase